MPPDSRVEASSVHAGPDWPPAVVASLHQTGTNLVRDLCRRGVRASGVDNNPGVIGFRSVYGEHHLCPDPDTAGPAWLDFMKSLAQKLGQRPVLMCAADIFVAALGRYARELEPYYRFSPAAELQAALCTKERQYALAEQYGMPRPLTSYIQSKAQLSDFVERARFPCLLKPRQEREWASLPESHPFRPKKAVLAGSASDLVAHYSSVEPYRPEAVAQEMIAGPDNNKYCYLAVYASDGSRLGHCIVRELRCFPAQLGSASMVRHDACRDIDEICDTFLRKLGYVGLCEIEVKRDALDGAVKLIEVNPRFSGTGDCSSYAGVEVGWLHYLDLIGQNPAPVEPLNNDFHHIIAFLEVPGVVTHLASGLLAWPELIRSYRAPLAFYDFNGRDLRATVKTMWECFKNAAVIFRRNGFRLWPRKRDGA